jgi:hypothetical protein
MVQQNRDKDEGFFLMVGQTLNVDVRRTIGQMVNQTRI